MFIYLMMTVVGPRLGETLEQYTGLRQMQCELLDASAAAIEIEELTRRRNSLDSLLTSKGGEFDQTTTGVVQLLTRKATASHVRIESLHPMDVERQDKFENIGFRLSLASRFHDIGSYVNALETSEIPIEINRIDLSVQAMRAPTVHVDIEGVARVLHTSGF
jgi:hypothetical protein